jgi:hypothetical protein
MNVFTVVLVILLVLSGIFACTYLFTDDTEEISPTALERKQTEAERTGEVPVSVSESTPTLSPGSQEVTDLSSDGLTQSPLKYSKIQ